MESYCCCSWLRLYALNWFPPHGMVPHRPGVFSRHEKVPRRAILCYMANEPVGGCRSFLLVQQYRVLYMTHTDPSMHETGVTLLVRRILHFFEYQVLCMLARIQQKARQPQSKAPRHVSRTSLARPLRGAESEARQGRNVSTQAGGVVRFGGSLPAYGLLRCWADLRSRQGSRSCHQRHELFIIKEVNEAYVHTTSRSCCLCDECRRFTLFIWWKHAVTYDMCGKGQRRHETCIYPIFGAGEVGTAHTPVFVQEAKRTKSYSSILFRYNNGNARGVCENLDAPVHAERKSMRVRCLQPKMCGLFVSTSRESQLASNDRTSIFKLIRSAD